MKKFVLLLTLLLGGMPLGAQIEESVYGDEVKFDVKMKYVYSFEEALKKAREENKPIFVNWFEDWAVPCHAMNKYVFSDQKFADYMDTHFVNLWINAKSTDGKAWAEKYDVHTMAQYSVLDKNGNVIFRIIGGKQLPEFQELLALSLDPKTTIQGVDARYEKGERSQKFFRTYIDVLDASGQSDKRDSVFDEFIATLKDKDLVKKENWKYVSRRATDRESELFKKLISRKEEFAKNVGREKVEQFISNVYFAELFPYACSSTAYDSKKMADIYLEMFQCLPDTSAIFGIYKITKLRGEKRYAELTDAMRTILKDNYDQWAMNIDLTLGDIKGLPNDERDVLIAYLQERAQAARRPAIDYYNQAIRNLENKEGIQFSDLSFEEALKKAGEEGKRVFMDCYTTWCGPCRVMNMQVFPQKIVGDYFNEHFISLKMDMEKGEGKMLLEKYQVEGFPTMFVLEPDGSVVCKMVGSRGAQKLLDEVKKYENKL